MRGSFALVLHSHIPYVLSHGKWPHGTDWLMEATCETYLPLLRVLKNLVSDGIRPSITIGFTPILLEQLASTSFRDELPRYIEARVRIADDNIREFENTGQREMAALARHWRKYFVDLKRFYLEEINGRMVDEFSTLHKTGQIEIMTSGATHGYLPLLGSDTSVSAQIKAGAQTSRRILCFQPTGFWLPECGYRPRYNWRFPIKEIDNGERVRKGVEEFLSEEGFRYFIIDSHLLRGGKAIGMYADRFEGLRQLWKQFKREYDRENAVVFEGDPHYAYLVNSSGEPKPPIAIFTRDPDTSAQVWSGEHGYPGDGWYLDFHKKHYPGALRYWRVTGSHCDLADKELYEVDKVRERFKENASHFVSLLHRKFTGFGQEGTRPPIVVSPYDTELLGHWWFEGISWVDSVIRLLDEDPEIDAVTCTEYLDESKPAQVVRIPEGSWGEGGYHFIWLNEKTEWTWLHIYAAETRLKELAEHHIRSPGKSTIDILKQAAVQLLLMQSSDWQFLISTGSAADYAVARFLEHHDSFSRLCDLAEKEASGRTLDQSDHAYIALCSERDPVFPDIELEWFTAVDFPAPAS